MYLPTYLKFGFLRFNSIYTPTHTYTYVYQRMGVKHKSDAKMCVNGPRPYVF